MCAANRDILHGPCSATVVTSRLHGATLLFPANGQRLRLFALILYHVSRHGYTSVSSHLWCTKLITKVKLKISEDCTLEIKMWTLTSLLPWLISADWCQWRPQWMSILYSESSQLNALALIVQQNSLRWFHIESSSSMWFLVPRSKPVKWVIVKVPACNQDSPDWVTV